MKKPGLKISSNGDFNEGLRHLTLYAPDASFVVEITNFDEFSEQSKKDIHWIWALITSPNFVFKKEHYSKELDNGVNNIKQGLFIQEIYHGGVLSWLEPFVDGNEPTNKMTNGIFVSVEGPPQILFYEWREYSKDKQGILIDREVQYGETVQLHVYTRNLYGKEIEISLYDDIGINEDLPFHEKDYYQWESEDGPAYLDEISEYNLPIKGYEKIRREVLSHPTTFKPKISEYVQTEVNEVLEIQKCVVDIYIDPTWVLFANKPMFSSHKGLNTEIGLCAKIYFKEKKLTILYPKGLEKETSIRLKGGEYTGGSRLDPEGNKPVLVSGIEMNVADYYHCRYNKIVLKTQDKAGEDIIFDSGIIEHRKSNIIQIDIISGKKETKLIDFEFETIECNQEPSHFEHEIKLLSSPPPEMTIKIDLNSTNSSHTVVAEEEHYYRTDLKGKFHTSLARSTFNEQVESESGTMIVRKNQIEFDAFYNYDIPQSIVSPYVLYKALKKYFWLPNLGSEIMKYQFSIASCAYHKNLEIAIYPDIKWTLKFGFNVTKEFVQSLNSSGVESPLALFTLESYVDEKQKDADKKNEEFLENSKPHKDIRHEEMNKIRKAHKLPKKAKKSLEKDIKPKDKGNILGLTDILKNINFSLAETHYGEAVKNELSNEFIEEFYKKYKSNLDTITEVGKIIDGGHDKKESGQERKIDEFLKDNDNDKKKDKDKKKDRGLDGLRDRLKRRPVKYEVLYPKIAVSASWFYDKVDGVAYPHLAGRQGLGLEIALSAKPLIGVKITWDLLELLCRRHPIAYAILKAIDGLLYVLSNDKTAIRLDATFKGSIDTDVTWKHNLATGPKSITAKGKAAIELEIFFMVNIAKETKILNYQVILELGFSTSGKTGIGISTTLGIDAQGFYSQDLVEFEGLKFDFKAIGIVDFRKAKGKRKKEKSKGIFSIGGEIEGSITFLEYKSEQPKIYYNL